MINKDRLLQLFYDLLNINSPSLKEREIADFVIEKLKNLGLEVTEDNVGSKIGGNTGNIFAFLPSNTQNGKSIFLGAHLDTVEPTSNLNIVTKDGVISSDGTSILGADDKAGLAVIIEAVESIIENNIPHSDIQLVFNVAEEIGLCGSKNMNKENLNADLGYIFDTQKPAGGITVSAPSHENLFIEIKGKAAHAGMAPESGISAILAASNAISKMKLGRIDSETTANVGVIEGGKARNIVPDLVKIKAEARSRNQDKLIAQSKHMKEIFESEASAIGAEAKVEIIREYDSYRWSENDDVIKLAVSACKKCNIEPHFMDGGGGSDANNFNSYGVPCVVIGLGYDNAHSSSENIAIDDLVKSCEYAHALILSAVEGI
ncbi:MAG: M20/M25/M40 family metallo-hydrolase [Armatimonadota bacterium]